MQIPALFLQIRERRQPLVSRPDSTHCSQRLQIVVFGTKGQPLESDVAFENYLDILVLRLDQSLQGTFSLSNEACERLSLLFVLLTAACRHDREDGNLSKARKIREVVRVTPPRGKFLVHAPVPVGVGRQLDTRDVLPGRMSVRAFGTLYLHSSKIGPADMITCEMLTVQRLEGSPPILKGSPGCPHGMC